MKWKLAVALAALLLGPAAAAQGDAFARFGCAAKDRDCQVRAMRAHPARKAGTWAAQLAEPVAQRIHVAPPALVEFLTLDNVFHGYPERPRAATLDDAFKRDVQAALADLPPQVLRAVSPKLAGIYLVDDLGGTGFTDAVFEADGRTASGFIVLDAAVLAQRTANAWASWKEGTPFKPDPAWQLKARIADGDADNRKNAIQYILLHEIGHVLSIGEDIHPPWSEEPRAHAAGVRWPFFEMSWRNDRPGNRYRALPEHEFAQRERVVYYFGARLEAAEMLPTYNALERTNFPTLYAATRPADDFAEAFAKYVHVRLMGRPWEITLWRSGKPVKTVASCWGTRRCAAKEAYLDKLLAATR